MKHNITIVSIGSGDPDLLNIKTISTIKKAESLILRTGYTPFTSWLIQNNLAYKTLDEFYETSSDFDQLIQSILNTIFEQASRSNVVYAVFDALSDRTVQFLLNKADQPDRISIIPGISFHDLYLSSALSFRSTSALTVIPAYDLLIISPNPNQTILITEIDNELLSGQIKLTLGSVYNDDHEIVFFHNVMQQPLHIKLFELDRQKHYDHMTAVLIPGSGFLKRNRFVMDDLILLMDNLRSDNGCSWDRQQTHQSLRPYLIEEAWECIDSIDHQDYVHLSEELGDLLFQIVFHSSIGKAFDEFSIDDVITSICSKMIRRHPHVFADAESKSTDDIVSAWEIIKQSETGHQSLLSSLEDVSSTLPSLKYAVKTIKKLRQSEAFKRDDRQILNDMAEAAETADVNDTQSLEKTISRMLICCCELGLNHNIDPELILHQAIDSRKQKLKKLEKMIKNDGKAIEHLTFEELGVYLNYVEGEIE